MNLMPPLERVSRKWRTAAEVTGAVALALFVFGALVVFL